MKEDKSKEGSIISYIKEKKTVMLIIVMVLLGIVLLLASERSSETETGANDDKRLQRYTEAMENKIEELCSSVKGVSGASVTVYFDCGFETVYAYDEESKATASGMNSEKKYVTLGSGNNESMVLVVEKMPSISGVAIVCRGGGDPILANELINLISSAFNVPKNKIYVAEGKK